MSSVTMLSHKPLVTVSLSSSSLFDKRYKHKGLRSIVLHKLDAWNLVGVFFGVISSHLWILLLMWHLQAECLTKTGEFSVCQSESHRLRSILHSLGDSLNIAVCVCTCGEMEAFTLDRGSNQLLGSFKDRSSNMRGVCLITDILELFRFQ